MLCPWRWARGQKFPCPRLWRRVNVFELVFLTNPQIISPGGQDGNKNILSLTTINQINCNMINAHFNGQKKESIFHISVRKIRILFVVWVKTGHGFD